MISKLIFNKKGTLRVFGKKEPTKTFDKKENSNKKENFNKKRNFFLLLGLLGVLLIINYPYLDSKIEQFVYKSNYYLVSRVIDGDTIVLENDERVRLLGIDAPERGEFYFNEAKEFLENEILNKSIRLEFVGERQDKYYRTLAYIHFDNENINVKIVENGFANYYFYDGRDKYSNALEKAWEDCLNKNINLCKKSEDICASCVGIDISKKFIHNDCFFSCDLNDWEISGEGRNKIIFQKILKPKEKEYFEIDLTYSGGGLFLRDFKGDLVDWKK